MAKKTKRKRGFSAMSPEQQREIAAKGGRAAHKKHVAHQFDAESAARAGRKGGRRVAQDRAHMAEIGRKGGKSKKKGAAKAARDAAKAAPKGDS